MSDRYEEIECYECGRLKTILIWRGRCVTCVVQRLEFNLEENDTLRCENAALETRVAELEDGLRVITQYPDVREYVGTICHDVALSALKGSDGAAQ